MFLSLFLCYILFLPVFGGIKTNLTNANILETSTKPENVLRTMILTEGGPTVQSTPKALSTQDVKTVLVSLEDPGSEKSLEQSLSSNIKARKGVTYDANTTTTTTENPSMLKVDKQNYTSTNTSSVFHQNDVNASITMQKPLTDKKLNHTTMTLPHKPLRLSNEPLDKMNSQIIETDMSGLSKKVAPLSASRHPGMVMPIVITILVVPMFAVLGYMALRRGQEAWKNRHYKRMDFLLDGMYNE